MRYRVWIDISMLERLLDSFTTINVFESGNLETMLILVYLYHFPAKLNINSAFVTFFKSNLVSIWELEDFFVRSPVLDLSIW